MKLIIVSKKIYPINNRSKNCPIPPGILQTFEFKRTIKQLKGEIKHPTEYYFEDNEICWRNCTRDDCPAKKQLEKTLS
jgi:hypothetical protein